MAENFSTEVNATDEATVIHVRGEIDMGTAGRLRDAIEPHNPSKAAHRVLTVAGATDLLETEAKEHPSDPN